MHKAPPWPESFSKGIVLLSRWFFSKFSVDFICDMNRAPPFCWDLFFVKLEFVIFIVFAFSIYRNPPKLWDVLLNAVRLSIIK